MDILTKLCLAGAVVLFAAWVAAVCRKSFAYGMAAIRQYRTAFLLAVAGAAIYGGAKNGATNEPPQGASPPMLLMGGDVTPPENSDGQSCPHCGYYDDRTKGGNWSHTAADGAGPWHTVLGSGYVMTDFAGRKVSYATPWSEGSKTWQIPMSWGEGGVLEFPFATNPTTQEFTLYSNGTFRIRKFGHEAERNVLGFIWKDGELQW